MNMSSQNKDFIGKVLHFPTHHLLQWTGAISHRFQGHQRCRLTWVHSFASLQMACSFVQDVRHRVALQRRVFLQCVCHVYHTICYQRGPRTQHPKPKDCNKQCGHEVGEAKENAFPSLKANRINNRSTPGSIVESTSKSHWWVISPTAGLATSMS